MCRVWGVTLSCVLGVTLCYVFESHCVVYWELLCVMYGKSHCVVYWELLCVVYTDSICIA